MGVTSTTICNLALDHIGEANISSIDDSTSQQAIKCKQHYDLALDSMLEEHEWGFAERRVSLALIPSTTFDPEDTTSYQYAYSYPGDCLVAHELYNGGAGSAGSKIPFILMTNAAKDVTYIVTNQEDACLIYTASTNSFTTMKSRTFQRALSHRLAAMIAMPITKDRQLRDDNLNMEFGTGGLAKTKDSNEQEEEMEDFNGYKDAMKI